MNYTVTVRFIADSAQYVSSPLASLRGAEAGDGWVIRIDKGILLAVSAPPEYMPVSMRLNADGGEHVLEWRVIDDRHELWLDGECCASCMGGLALGSADVLRRGEDPEMPGKTYSGVLEVTIG